MSTSFVWETAARSADFRLDLPSDLSGGVPLFLRHITATGKNFTMGFRGNSLDIEPQHKATLCHDYYLGTFVVTQEQWRAVANSSATLCDRASPSYYPGPRRPVERVSWDDVVMWCHELMLTPEWRKVASGLVARPPSADEWEFACRGGSETEYYCGDGEASLAKVAWYSANSGRTTHPVDEALGGQAEAHPFGLFGMHGNVAQWCGDVYQAGPYRRRIFEDYGAENPLGKKENRPDGDIRIVRGSSWDDRPEDCRSACRYGKFTNARGWDLGFRLCLAPDPAAAKSLAGKFAAARTETEQAKATDAAGAGGSPLPSVAMPPGFRGV